MLASAHWAVARRIVGWAICGSLTTLALLAEVPRAEASPSDAATAQELAVPTDVRCEFSGFSETALCWNPPRGDVGELRYRIWKRVQGTKNSVAPWEFLGEVGSACRFAVTERSTRVVYGVSAHNAAEQASARVEVLALPIERVSALTYNARQRRFTIHIDEMGEDSMFFVEAHGSYRELGTAEQVQRGIDAQWTNAGDLLQIDRRHRRLDLHAPNGERLRVVQHRFAGEALIAPRAFCFLPWGELAIFDGANGNILCGDLYAAPTPIERPKLDRSGPFDHPIIYEEPVLQPRVLVLNYDPLLPAADVTKGEVRLTQLAGWHDPQQLAAEFREDLYCASGGYVLHRIVEWRELDSYPKKVDGFQYDDASYLAAKAAGKWHDPDRLDYPRMIADQGLAALVASGAIDEVWMFGGPAFGFYETQMVGPGAYWCNSPGIDEEASARCFVIFGFNYERGVAEMIHDLGHMTESILSRVYDSQVGPWKVEERRSAWERFAALDKHHAGLGAVGNCHFPVNGERDYDYANPRSVPSLAAQWKFWPEVDPEAEPALVSSATWGGPDFHRNYQRWFFSHLPRRAGRAPDGRLANWWEYLFHFNAHAESRGR